MVGPKTELQVNVHTDSDTENYCKMSSETFCLFAETTFQNDVNPASDQRYIMKY